jgi:hypothetical protein
LVTGPYPVTATYPPVASLVASIVREVTGGIYRMTGRGPVALSAYLCGF